MGIIAALRQRYSATVNIYKLLLHVDQSMSRRRGNVRSTGKMRDSQSNNICKTNCIDVVLLNTVFVHKTTFFQKSTARLLVHCLGLFVLVECSDKVIHWTTTARWLHISDRRRYQ